MDLRTFSSGFPQASSVWSRSVHCRPILMPVPSAGEKAMRRKQRHDKKTKGLLDLETSEFLPDEASVDAKSSQTELFERLVRLEQQMSAQYTAMAAYAT